MKRYWVAPFLVLLNSAFTLADDPVSKSPYIDEIKKDLQENRPETESYTQSLKKKLEESASPESKSKESYTEALKKELNQGAPSESFIAKQKALLKPVETGGAIQALQEGRSELHPRIIDEDVRSCVGFRIGGALSREVTPSAGVSLESFSTIYGSSNAPEWNFFYEYRPLRSEVFGNIGILGEASVAYFKGDGLFQFQTHDPFTGGFFSQQSNTKFLFVTVPVTFGLSYRFNLLRYVLPFANAGMSVIGYQESRNDGLNGHSGISTGLNLLGGVAFPLDWVSRSARWDLYSDYGIKHYYLTVNYSRLTPISGDVKFSSSGVLAGLTFEF